MQTLSHYKGSLGCPISLTFMPLDWGWKLNNIEGTDTCLSKAEQRETLLLLGVMIIAQPPHQVTT